MADIEDIIRGATGRFVEAEQRSIICFAVQCEAPGCDHELLIPRPRVKINRRDQAGKEPIYLHAIEVGMDHAGWTFRRHRSRPLCPEHHPPRLTHAPKPEAPKEPVLVAHDNTILPAPAVAPAKPPQPSRGDNQRIHDELDACYDLTAGRYKGDGSDEKVAKKLGVPRLWVTTLRLALFGEHDRNEAAEDDKTIAAAMDLLAEADAKQKRAAELAADAKLAASEAQAAISRARAMIDGVRRPR